jgi:dienelactone hydrolase
MQSISRRMILFLALFLRGFSYGSELDDYFAAETKHLADNCLADVQSLDQWKGARERHVRELREMLGLDPWPERTDLNVTITGKIEAEDFTVEKLHFQSMPRLYVTANLYLPKTQPKPVPAILYVCGHGPAITNGISYGNKVAYQHHGAWFARNGYVCIIIDTIQLGEIQGLHHGTYEKRMWWWNSRGYTPAGVEAWNSIRAIDYLQTRPEVDPEKIGITGRSGGGAYSWWAAALDERIKVVAPVAGITDLQNHVIDGTVEGHCDCMFMLDTYRWDYPMVAALVAPRPLLIGNSDKDTIFPLDGVYRTHQKVAKIYKLYNAMTNFGLLITEGPHKDTQELQVPVFRWFNRFLKGENLPIEMVAKPFFTGQQLKVFESLPEDERTSKIHESFVPMVDVSAQDSPNRKAELIAQLKEKVFRAWPDHEPILAAKEMGSFQGCRHIELNSQEHAPIHLYITGPENSKLAGLIVLDADGWETFTNAKELPKTTERLAYLAPRGIGPTKSQGDAKKHVQIRRRYMLLGETLDSMRVWDIRCAIHYLANQGHKIEGEASGEMGVNLLYAALFEPSVEKLHLSDLPKSHMDGADYLNVLRVTDIPEVLRLVSVGRELLVDNSRAGR